MSEFIIDPTDPTKAIVVDKPNAPLALAGSVFFRPAGDDDGEWMHLGFIKDALGIEGEDQ